MALKPQTQSNHMILTLKEIAEKVDQVPCHYYMDIIKFGIQDDDKIIIADELYSKMKEKYENTQGFCAKKASPYRAFFDKFNGAKHELPAPQVMPGLGQMAKNLAGTLAAGISQVSEEEQKRREELCNGCQYYTKNIQGAMSTKENHRCLLCGCYMNLKRRLASGRCDIGKWGESEPAKDGEELQQAPEEPIAMQEQEAEKQSIEVAQVL